jgi:hypothetical protein
MHVILFYHSAVSTKHPRITRIVTGESTENPAFSSQCPSSRNQGAVVWRIMCLFNITGPFLTNMDLPQKQKD